MSINTWRWEWIRNGKLQIHTGEEASNEYSTRNQFYYLPTAASSPPSPWNHFQFESARTLWNEILSCTPRPTTPRTNCFANNSNFEIVEWKFGVGASTEPIITIFQFWIDFNCLATPYVFRSRHFVRIQYNDILRHLWIKWRWRLPFAARVTSFRIHAGRFDAKNTVHTILRDHFLAENGKYLLLRSSLWTWWRMMGDMDMNWIESVAQCPFHCSIHNWIQYVVLASGTFRISIPPIVSIWTRHFRFSITFFDVGVDEVISNVSHVSFDMAKVSRVRSRCEYLNAKREHFLDAESGEVIMVFSHGHGHSTVKDIILQFLYYIFVQIHQRHYRLFAPGGPGDELIKICGAIQGMNWISE